ncbi:MAG: helix-turn-helix transcriptional regulator [Clostridiales bacterium]|nr:helix-turn-helix transcriptional regulator [Clostridiales bacterium]
MGQAFFLFKREEGQSLTDYITAVRIAKAKELLRQPDARVYDVAFLIGFRDEKYFSRTFKKVTGMTASSVFCPSANGHKYWHSRRFSFWHAGNERISRLIQES